MIRQDFPGLCETVYREVLPNGLTVCVVPRPGFSRKVAYFATDYGSLHRKFTVDGQSVEAPAGVAHFLEHKMFDLPGRDVTAEFAALGASPNAFTSYDMTAYYFSCTENFPAALRLLLEFVTTPYFTPETVAKEQGIIGQEIGMNADSPETRVFENLMGILYENHRITEPILGTVESIARIDDAMLHTCHRSFYRPDNMILCVVGDVDPAEVAAIAAEKTPEKPGAVVTAERSWQEAMAAKTPEIRDTMEIAMPTFQLGFKCPPPGKGTEAVRQEFLGDLAAEALFGESSPLFLRLYESGVIDGSFGGGFETVEGMAMLTAGGDSREPETVRDAILEEARRIGKEGIPEGDFLRMKRSSMGRRIRGLDSFDSLCFRLCAYHFSGYDYFGFPAIYETITAEDIRLWIQQAVTPDRCGLSVICPKEKEA